MITEALRAKALELMRTECVHKQAWHQLVTALLESQTSAEFGLPLKQEPKYSINLDGRLVNRATGQAIPDDEPIMIFRGKDLNAAPTILQYAYKCVNGKHHAVVMERIQDFERFALEHSEKMREPD